MENFCLPAVLNLQQGTPFSDEYQDVYFSSDEGYRESEYVFLQHNRLPERWQQDAHRATFRIAETGFGSGLNFYLTLKHWCETSDKQFDELHYVSSELHPFTRADFLQLSETLFAYWPELRPTEEVLVRDYPEPVSGFHTLRFAQSRVILTLLFGDNTELYQQLLLPPGQGIDAWYLDGFAPDRNPQMWTPAFFQRMAALSDSGTTFSTFTAASDIRRALQSVGFEVEKAPGFGRKREMLTGRLAEMEQTQTNMPPWFALPDNNNPARDVVVIGAGLAGSAMAWRLAEQGYTVTVLDKHDSAAQGASSNRAGVVYPPINQQANTEYQYYAQAYRDVIPQLQTFADDQVDFSWSNCGVLQLAPDEKRRDRYRGFAEGVAARDYVQWVSAGEASDLAGVALQGEGLFFAQGGYVEPQALCRRYLEHDNIHCVFNTEVSDLQREKDGWQLTVKDSNGAQTLNAARVVIANAVDFQRLLPGYENDVGCNRGQVSYVPEEQALTSLKTVLCYTGYATPVSNGVQVIGATVDNECSTELRDADHVTNLEQLNSVLAAGYQLDTGLVSISGNVGLRTVTTDHLPLVGPAPDRDFYLQQYADLRDGKPQQRYPKADYLPGLYLSVAHGARGISSSWLAARMIVALLSGEAMPVPQEVYQAVHPGRFLVRALRKGSVD